MFKKIFAALTIILAVSACAGIRDDMAEPSRYEMPDFSSEEPIRLKVSKIDVISEFTPTFKRPNVEHLLPISIEKTARSWAEQRLDAVDFSSPKVAKFIIKDASVTEENIKVNDMFKADRIKYHARLVVTINISDPNSLSVAETTIEAWRDLTIPNTTDIEDKEKYWNEMVKKLFEEFNVNMEKNINQYLNMYVVGNDYIQQYS